MRTLLTLLTLLATSAVAPAQTFDAEKSLQELNKWYASTLKSLSKETKGSFIPIGDVYRSVGDDRQQRALALVGKVPPHAIPPRQSLAAAELYCYADLASNKVAAAKRFLTTKPEPSLRYQAHHLLLEGYERLSDAAGLRSVLREIKPPSTKKALQLMNETASVYTRVIAAKLGADIALEVLRRVESLAPPDALVKDKKEGDLAENVVANLAGTRASLLSSLGRTGEARRVLQGARSKVKQPLNLSILDRAANELGPVTPPKK